MNCYDCAAFGIGTPAVGVCTGCGAGLCMDHAVIGVRHLTRVGVINRVETVVPPARVVYCNVCAAAVEAQARPHARHAN